MKKIFERLSVFATVLLSAGQLSAVDIENSFYQNGKKMHGFSVCDSYSNPRHFVAAGTVVTSTNPASDTADVQITEYNWTGNVVFSTRISSSINEYAYNIIQYNGNYVVTGVSKETVGMRAHVWIVNTAGTIINHKIFSRGTTDTYALNTIATSDGSLLLMGFSTNNNVVPSSTASKLGFVLKLNSSLGIIWNRSLNSTNTASGNDHDMCESAVETPTAYFITGSRNSTGQAVLALWINKTNGATIADRSFRTTTTSNDCGASACYVNIAGQEKIYLLYNSNTFNNFGLVEYTGTTRTNSVRYDNFDQSKIHHYGYSIAVNPTNSQELIVVGMISSVSVTDALGNTISSRVPFKVAIDRIIGSINYGTDFYHKVAYNTNISLGSFYYNHGGLSQPYIFTPNIYVSEAVLSNFIGYRREHTNDVMLEVFLDEEVAISDGFCNYEPLDLTHTSYTVTALTALASTTTTWTVGNATSTSAAIPMLRTPCSSPPCINQVANAGPDITCGDAFIGTAAQAGATYSWTVSPAANILSNTTIAQPYVAYGNNGVTYTLTLTMTNRCGEVTTDQITVFYSTGCVGRLANPSLGETTTQIFPNPGNGTFTFNYTAEETDQVQVQMFDMTGRPVATASLNQTGQQLTFDQLADGVYICMVTVNGKLIKQERLIIQR